MAPGSFRTEAGHREDQGRIRGLEFTVLSPASCRGEGLKVELVTSGQGFNQSCICNEAAVKPQKHRV